MTTLPPLTEKIDKGAAGGHEFERLLHRLLLRDGQRQGYHYEPASGPSGDWRGVDGLVRKGRFLGLDAPIGIQFKWVWGDPTLGSNQRAQVRESISQAARLYPDLKHWVLVTPHELSNADKDWLERLNDDQRFYLHHRGQLQMEDWLHDHPALLARYYPEAARNHPEARGYDGTNLKSWGEQYHAKVAEFHRNLRLLGLPPRVVQHQDNSGGDIALKKVFVPPTFIPWGRDDNSRLSLAQILIGTRPRVVLGDAGYGKSTVLQFLALLHLGEAKLRGAPIEARVPLFISLGEFIRRQGYQARFSFVDALVDHAHSSFQMREIHPYFFESMLLMGEAVVLLDGLDEAGHATRRGQLARAIEALNQEYPDCPMWVTSRIVGYSGNARLKETREARKTSLGEDEPWFDHFVVARFATEQQRIFIGNWYQVQLPTDACVREERIRSLVAAVERTPGVRRLAPSPLLLTLMALIHHYQGHLPQSRGQLYDMCVEMLLEHWQKVKAPDEPHPLHQRGIYAEEVKRHLAALALWMQERNEKIQTEDARGLVPEPELEAKLLEIRLAARRDDQKVAALEDVKALLDYIRDRTGLLVFRGAIGEQDQFAFAHLSFQEYLAAYQLSEDRSRSSEDHLAFFREHVGRPTWQETLLVLLYRLSQSTGKHSFLDMIMGDTVRAEEKPGESTSSKTAAPSVLPLAAPAPWIMLGRALRDDLDFAHRDGREIVARLLSAWAQEPRMAGDLFQVLEEIALFSRRWQPLLVEELQRNWSEGPPSLAVACLHLHVRLLDFPNNAAAKLAARKDAIDLAPDLVLFNIRTDGRAALATQATVAHWAKALHAVDSPNLYLQMLDWPNKVLLHAASPSQLSGACALLAGKVLDELASRAAFARTHRTNEAAVLFERCGAIRVKHPHYSLTMPLATLRACSLQRNPYEADLTGLLCPALAWQGLNGQARQAEACLITWSGAFMQKLSHSFSALEARVFTLVATTFVRFFVHHFVRGFLPDLVRDFDRTSDRDLGPDFRRDFRRDFVRDFVRDFGRGVGRDSHGSFGCDFVHDFGRDFVRDFDRHYGREFGRDVRGPFVRAFGEQVVNACSRAFVRTFGGAIGRDFAGTFTRTCAHLFGLASRSQHLRAEWGQALGRKENLVRLLSDEGFWWPAFFHSNGMEGDPLSAGLGVVADLSNPLSLPFLMMDLWNPPALNYFLALARHLAVLNSHGTCLGAWQDWTRRNPLEVFGVAMAWEEHAKKYAAAVGRLAGPAGALILAHASYATLMTGLIGGQPNQIVWERLLKDSDSSDPLIQFNHLLYRICLFKDSPRAMSEMNNFLGDCPRECREVLECAGWLRSSRPAVKLGEGP